MAGGFASILPLVVLLVLVGVVGFVGYGLYTWTQELSARTERKMEKKHMSFTKDGGLRVGVKEMKNEDYADRTQRALVKTWNASYSDGNGGNGAAASGFSARS